MKLEESMRTNAFEYNDNKHFKRMIDKELDYRIGKKLIDYMKPDVPYELVKREEVAVEGTPRGKEYIFTRVIIIEEIE